MNQLFLSCCHKKADDGMMIQTDQETRFHSLSSLYIIINENTSI